MAQLTKPNILHNWDFRNPVNQRYQTTYTNNVYTIDRWQSYHASGLVSIITGGLRIGTENFAFRQYIEYPEKYAGLTLTLSALVTDVYGSGDAALSVRTSDGLCGQITFNQPGFYQATFTLPNSLTMLAFDISSSVGGYVDVAAVKLELGTTSTLANDPPIDYGKELAVCQRHQWVLDLSTNPQLGIGVIDILYGANERTAMLSLCPPLPLRVKPALSLLDTPTITVYDPDYYERAATIIAVTGTAVLKVQLAMDGTPPAASGQAVIVIGSGGKLVFDANL